MADLAPNEGLNALRHPDCRACNERERLSLGQLTEIKALKTKLRPVEQERDRFKAERDELLQAIEEHSKRPAGTVRPITIADEDLYSIAKKVRGEG